MESEALPWWEDLVAREYRKNEIKAREQLKKEIAYDQFVEVYGEPKKVEPVAHEEFLKLAETPIEWLMEPAIVYGGLTLFLGMSNASKSTNAAEIIRASLAGDLAFGHFPTKKINKAVAIVLEGAPQIVAKQYKRCFGLEGFSFLPMMDNLAAANLDEQENMATLVDICRDADLVVIDCLNPLLDSFGLTEETTAIGYVAGRVNLLKGLANVRHVVLLAHSNQDDSARASKQLEGKADGIVIFRGEKDKPREFAIRKNKGGQYPEGMIYQDPDSLILTFSEGIVKGDKNSESTESIEWKICNMVPILDQENMSSEDALAMMNKKRGILASTVRKSLIEDGVFPNDGGNSRQKFKEIVDRLIDDGLLWGVEEPAKGRRLFRNDKPLSPFG